MGLTSFVLGSEVHDPSQQTALLKLESHNMNQIFNINGLLAYKVQQSMWS